MMIQAATVLEFLLAILAIVLAFHCKDLSEFVFDSLHNEGEAYGFAFLKYLKMLQ